MPVLYDDGSMLLVAELQDDGTFTIKYYEVQETLTLRAEEWEEYIGLRHHYPVTKWVNTA